MSKLWYREFLMVVGFISICLASGASSQGIDSKVLYEKHFANDDKGKSYCLASALEGVAVPVKGFGLIIVIPNGKDIGNCESFVKQLSQSMKYLVAELSPTQLQKKDGFVWPTTKHRNNGLKFSTEEFVHDVVESVKNKYKVNPEQVFTLSWGSGGLAGYAISLQKSKSVTGSYLANSPFDPKELPSLETAKGHGYVIDYCPSNKVPPSSMALNAGRMLEANGAKIKLLANKKNSEWETESFARIRYGFRWLEKNHGKGIIKVAKSITKVEEIKTVDVKSVDDQKHFDPNSVDPSLLVEPLVGIGDMKLGMSKENMIKHFGESVSQNAGGSSKRLNYDSIGMVITIHAQKGVTKINCFGDKAGKHFAFITNKGVEIGATQTEIERIYGKVKHIQKLSEDLTLLDFPMIRTSFMMMNGKLCQIVLFASKM